MTTLTKKQHLEKKYKEFSTAIGEAIGVTNLFPSLDEVCMIDILLLFQYTFWDAQDYRGPVRAIIASHHVEITEEQFEKIYPIVEAYVNDLKHFLRTN